MQSQQEERSITRLIWMNRAWFVPMGGPYTGPIPAELEMFQKSPNMMTASYQIEIHPDGSGTVVYSHGIYSDIHPIVTLPAGSFDFSHMPLWHVVSTTNEFGGDDGEKSRLVRAENKEQAIALSGFLGTGRQSAAQVIEFE